MTSTAKRYHSYVCPTCSSDQIQLTTMGHIPPAASNNKAYCLKCGWAGKEPDLLRVEITKEEYESRV